MTLATDPLAPQRDLSVNELRSGVNYGSGVSYLNGVPNPAGVRSGKVTICTTLAQFKTAVTGANYGDDIVIPNGTANAITTDGTQVTFPILPTITASTPRQSPPPMMTYSSAVGLIIASPVPMTSAPPALASKPAMASVIPQGDPSYVRIMSGQAEQIGVPPPHTTWHVTNYERFAHLIQGEAFTPILGTPDTWTHYDHHHFRMEGIRFDNLPGFAAGNAFGGYVLVGSGNAQVTNTGALRAPDHFIFDRVFLDGASQGTGVRVGGYGSNRGISGFCDYFALINSRTDGNYGVGGASYNLESNALSFGGGIGPTHIENNWLTGAGEITLMNPGPSVGYPAPYLQSDGTFTKNWCIRPLTWRETFHYNAVAPNQVPGGSTVTLDAPGTTGIISNPVTTINQDVYQPGDVFWTATTGRPVSIATLDANGQTFTLVSPYTENAGTAGNRGIFARGRLILAGADATTVTLSGAGNRTVTSSTGTTTWLTSIKSYADTPPPGSGLFFGVNQNTTSAFQLGSTNNQKFWPVLAQVATVDSDTQLTLAEDYTAGTWSSVYFTATLWDGVPRSVMKNLHEWKGSNRIRVLGNVFENAWETFNGQGPNAWALNIAADGTFSYHRDQYYGYNLVISAGLLHYYTGYPYNTGGPPQDLALLPNRRMCMEHNLFVDVANRKWISDYGVVPGINIVYQGLHPLASAGVGGSGSAHDYQVRHCDVILSTDTSYETSFQLMAFQVDASDPQQVMPQYTFRDTIAHVGSHAVSRGGQTGGFVGGLDADDFDKALLGTAAGSGGAPVSADSIVAHNVFMRNSAPTIAAHGVQFGSNVSGFLNESSVAFTNYGNVANVPYWLTQSVVPSDYALATIYQTDASACTVSGATVSVSSGTIPITVGLGTPFRIVGDPALVIQRVTSRDSATQVTLTAPYVGHTGAGLTGLFSFVGTASDGTASTVFVSNTGAATVSNITSVSYTETFPTNGATLNGQDQPWVQTLNSVFGVAGNAAQVQTSGPSGFPVCQTSLRSPSHFAQLTLSAFSGSSQQAGVVVNSAADGSSMYVFASVPTNSNNELFKLVGGSKTSLATSGAAAAVVGDVLKLEYVVATATLTCSVNGASVISFTDPSPIASNNFAGMYGLRASGGDAVSLDTFSAQTNTTLGVSLVNLASGAFPSYVAPSGHGLFPRTFLVQGDAADKTTPLATYDSATQIALTGLYPGTTGAGLTGIVAGTVPTGANPGVDTETLARYIGNIRT